LSEGRSSRLRRCELVAVPKFCDALKFRLSFTPNTSIQMLVAIEKEEVCMAVTPINNQAITASKISLANSLTTSTVSTTVTSMTPQF